jgi:hypothetical protein
VEVREREECGGFGQEPKRYRHSLIIDYNEDRLLKCPPLLKSVGWRLLPTPVPTAEMIKWAESLSDGLSGTFWGARKECIQMKQRYLWVPMALTLALGSAAWSISAQVRRAALPAYTVLQVKLDETIGSDRNQRGDQFTATVNDSTLPEGTLVHGVVIGATKATGDKPGKLGLDFRTLELPDGQRIAISGTPIGLDSKSVTRTSDGRLVAKSHSSNSTGKYIAYGAAGGLLIGSLLGKNVVGGLLGAGAGYLIGKNKQKKAESRIVVLKDGTKMGVRLDRRVVVARR